MAERRPRSEEKLVGGSQKSPSADPCFPTRSRRGGPWSLGPNGYSSANWSKPSMAPKPQKALSAQKASNTPTVKLSDRILEAVALNEPR